MSFRQFSQAVRPHQRKNSPQAGTVQEYRSDKPGREHFIITEISSHPALSSSHPTAGRNLLWQQRGAFQFV